MRQLLFFFFALVSLRPVTAYAQGVRISSTTGDPDPSAMFEVLSSSKGVLVSRLTSAERDAIADPAEGLLVFNISTGCFDYFSQGQWREICGECTPQPSAASAGPDQQGVPGTEATLAANSPSEGAGQWTILSGSGGSFGGSPTSPNPSAVFTGEPGSSYTLQWTVTNGCGSSQDQVTISFDPGFCDPNPPGTLLIQSSGWCDPNPPAGWTQCAGWLNTDGDDVSNSVLDGCLNNSGRLRIRIWNASTGVLEEDVYSTNANVSAWQSWNYLGGSVTRATFTNWVGTTDFFTSTAGGSACYMNSNCGVDAPCGTLTLGTGNQSVILAPGAINQFEYRSNCNGPAYSNRIIALYK